MDDLDVKIIKILQENARITASEISSQINLSVPAVGERIRKLEVSGIIKKYTTIIDNRLLKKDLTAMIFVSIERPKFNDDFVEAIGNANEILECHYLAGDYDYSLKIITENTFSLEQLLNRIKSLPGVKRTKTIVVLSTLKSNYSMIPEEQ